MTTRFFRVVGTLMPSVELLTPMRAWPPRSMVTLSAATVMPLWLGVASRLPRSKTVPGQVIRWGSCTSTTSIRLSGLRMS
ncbi:MAG: hypothetical protein IPK26_24740 [Planctomycetes bacterium]|nr:hypothetical protein [Planctomycetota bacterium]